jgi:hypothetical protein
MTELKIKGYTVDDTVSSICDQQYSREDGGDGGTIKRCPKDIVNVAGVARNLSRLDGLNYSALSSSASGSRLSGSSPVTTSITQVWKDKDGNTITNPETPYICVDLTRKNEFCKYNSSSDAQKLLSITPDNFAENISYTVNNLCELTNPSYSKTFSIFLKGDIYCKFRFGGLAYLPTAVDTCWMHRYLPGANAQMVDFPYSVGGGRSDNVDITLPILDSIRRGKRQADVADHPMLPDATASFPNKAYAMPQRMQGTCKCLHPNGSVNTSAFIYNGKCVKCSSNNDVFYAKGETQSYTWGDDTTGCVADSGGSTGLSDTQFGSLEDAKEFCESQPTCRGVFRRSASPTGKSYYSATTVCGTDNTNNVSWRMSILPNKYKITTGDRAGDTFTDQPIPRAFADDYKHSSGANKPNNITTTEGAFDMYQSTSNMGSMVGSGIVNFIKNTIGIAAAENLFTQSIERPDTYYSLVGTRRVIKGDIDSTTDNNGICVGPCDPLHPIHDSIQLYYDGKSTPPLYELYGTTCHDATQITFTQPSIPAIYTAEKGEKCPPINNKIYSQVGDQCLEECSSGQIDSGTTCTTASIPRNFTEPCYSCPDGSSNCGGSKTQGSSNLPRLVDNVCVYPCDPGFTLDGDFCKPAPTIIGIPTSGSAAINCKSTPYLSKNKWLCESYEDLSALLMGYSAESGNTSSNTYVDPDDTVCVTDDSSTAMYYCQTVYEAVNQKSDTIRDNFNTTCDRLIKAYYDLSNNLNILSDVNTTAVVAARQVSKMYDTLNSVYQTLCVTGSSGSSGTMCATMNSRLNALRTNINLGSSISGSISSPINTAAQSRDQLISQMNKFKCSRFNANAPSA